MVLDSDVLVFFAMTTPVDQQTHDLSIRFLSNAMSLFPKRSGNALDPESSCPLRSRRIQSQLSSSRLTSQKSSEMSLALT